MKLKNNSNRIYSRLRHLSMRWKIFSLISVLILFALIVVGTISYQYSVKEAKTEWKERQEEITLSTVTLLDNHFLNIFQLLDQIASLSEDSETINDYYLRSVLEHTPYFYEIAIIQPDGEIYSSAWLDESLISNSFTIPQSNWFVAAKEGFRFISDLQQTSDDRPYVIIAQPTVDGNVLVTRIQISFFQNIISEISFGETGTFNLSNEDGKVIAHTNIEYVMENRQVPNVAYSDDFLIEPGSMIYGDVTNFAGVESKAALTRLKSNHWLVVSIIEISEINRASNVQLLFSVLGFVVFGVFILTAVLIMLNRYIFVPLTILQKGAEAIADGEYHHQIAITDEDELGRLAKSFNYMAQRIELRDQKLNEEIESKEQIAQALKISQERYALAVKGANDGIWDWNLNDNQIYYSSRWKNLLGYPDKEIGQSPQEWFGRIHEDDLENVKYHLNQHLSGLTPFFRCEFRIRRKDDIYIWVRYRGLVSLDEYGNAYRIAGSQTDITAQKEFEQRLHFAAYHDSLTNLPNRKYLTEKLIEIITMAKFEGKKDFALMFLDLDRFKIINDSLGHMKGDQILIMIAKRLSNWANEKDIVSRFGGDEFIIVKPNIESREKVMEELHQLQTLMNRPLTIDAQQLYIGMSVGIVIGPEQYSSPTEIIRDADIALYQAKSAGLSNYVVFDPGMRQKAVASMSIETDLREALSDHQFKLFYQPIVNLKENKLKGFEALIRWEHPVHGLVSPGQFIPIAEQTGMINHIGRWVIDESMRQLKDWQDNYSDISMSMNVSAKQLKDDTLLQSIEAALITNELKPETLSFEITETSVLEFDDATIEVLNNIKGLGVRLSLDDFGTGFSSLSVLHMYPIDTLKIDQTFIREILNDNNKIAIARTIIELGHSLGMNVIAEGVETDESLQLLVEFGCPQGQGYYFLKPMPAEVIEHHMREGNGFWKREKAAGN
jgi:diguanylate cyclase (GGDEF)-like protein/PAS domain S-box-containing protein